MKAEMSIQAKTYQLQPKVMDQVITPELLKLVKLFERYNHEIRIAGGAVRDLLAGKEKKPDDVDLATTATPVEMIDMFSKESIRTFNEQGIKHGTVSARIDDNVNFEITTLRIDKVTDGRHAEVEFTKDWMIDAMRRDLTINSMFLALDGTVYDYFNGKEDLDNKRIAFVGSADARIKEDYLRIFRYFRFYGRISQLEDNHESETLKAIVTNREGLSRISGERIWTEWKKILTGPMGGPITLKMIQLGLGPFMGLPEKTLNEKFDNCWRERKNLVHYITLLTHLLENQDDMMKLHMRLKMSGYERDMGLFILEHKNNPDCVSLKYWQKTMYMSRTTKNINILRDYIEQVIKCQPDYDELLQQFMSWQQQMPRFPLSGKDILETNLVPRGKLVGICLNNLKEIWIDSDFQVDADHLLKVELPKIATDMIMTIPKKK